MPTGLNSNPTILKIHNAFRATLQTCCTCHAMSSTCRARPGLVAAVVRVLPCCLKALYSVVVQQCQQFISFVVRPADCTVCVCRHWMLAALPPCQMDCAVSWSS